MEKDPKKLTPGNAYNKTYPGQVLNNGVAPHTTDMLPVIFRTETNKKVLSAIVEDLFQPSSIETLNYTIGRKPSSAFGPSYLPHPAARRQGELGLLSFADSGVKTLTADNIATAWKLNTRDNESPSAISILDLPIDPDKYLNWGDYYWVEERMPVIFLTGGTDSTYSVQNDIVGKKFYTLPAQDNGRTLELKNGMRVVFQQFPNMQDVNGHLDMDIIASGTTQDQLGDIELVNYDNQLINIIINNQIQQNYSIVGNTIVWQEGFGPTAGQRIHLHLPDFYITQDSDNKIRSWLVTGVGTEDGIKLLGLHSQLTNSVYSKLSNALWDQTAIPWDRSEWDGFLPGINPKQYILQQPGAANRNAHSRTNVWIHKTAIQTLADFLDIKFKDIAKETNRAERPIVEYENTLELYNHGTQYRHWPTFLVNEENVSVLDFNEVPLKETNKTVLNSRYINLITRLSRPVDIVVQTEINGNLKLALDAQSVTKAELIKILENLDKDIAANRIPKYAVYEVVNNEIVWIKNAPADNWFITYRVSGVPLSALRILWLANGELKNKIVNLRNDGSQTIGRIVESANDNDAVVINVTSSNDPHYLHEYYWKDGVATKATFRTTAIELPKFEIYNADGIRVSDLEAIIGFRPNIQYTTILRPKAGTVLDIESGYKLTFDSDQFTQLTDGNVAKDSMYNIVYEHTLQTPSTYTTRDGRQLTVYGPYSFRRYAGGDTISELSNGYRRAWFRLKSWAIRSQEITGPTTLQLDESMWPTYEWAVKIDNGVGTVTHTDNFKPVVDNQAVVARGQTATFKVYHNSQQDVAYITGQGFEQFSVTVSNGVVEFTVPESAVDSIRVEIGFIGVVAKVIELKDDPRFIKLTLNSLPIEFTFNSNAYTVSVDGTGTLELRHQGNQADTDHLTTIPGLDYNAEQQDNLGELTVARLIDGLSKNVKINTASGSRIWVESPQYKTLDGIYMADHSAMRATWVQLNLTPNLQDIVVNRSQASYRWYRRFITKVEELNRLLDITNVQSTVDRVLEELLLGVTYSSVDAITGMAFITNAMTIETYTSAGEQTFAIPSGSVYTGVFGNDHVYVYVNGNLQLHGIDYTIVGNSVEFTTVTVAGDTVEIYHATEESIYSGIPASPAKLGLGGVFVPKLITETIGNTSRTYIRRHDGTRITAYVDPATGNASADYVINAVILELEKRIYNGCLNRVGDVNRQRSVHNYDAATVTESQARSQLEWYAVNGIDYRSRADFDAANPWTWNYGGASWRRMYIDMYGTDRLHEAPWEALGYDDKPVWWDNYYSWTDLSKRNELEIALRFGITSEPGTLAYTNPNFATNLTSFPVDSNGNLISPFDFGLATPTLSEARQPWEIGAMGPAEFAWRRSAAGSWSNVLNVIDNNSLVSEFFDSAINPFTTHIENNSVTPKGTGSIAPDQFFQSRPTIGIGAVLFEGYREFNLLGAAPLNELMSLSTRLEFSIGGFTDGNVTIKMPYSKYENSEYVPNEDFNLTLNAGVPVSQLRYTSVRVERDDVGFRVYGFDPGQRYFKVLTPTANALSSSYPTTRRQFVTPYGTFVEYLEWNATPVVVSYGSYIANKQDLVTFLLGLGEYQMAQGLVLDNIDERNSIIDWKQAATDALSWVGENWGNETYCIVGVATQSGLKFKHKRGFLSRLDAELGRTGKVIYSTGRSASANELLITRDFEENTDKIAPLSSEQIVFVNFETQDYDHVFFVNKKTKFGDLIVDSQCGNRLESFTLSGRRTYDWSGRPHARGVIPQQNSMLPGFDTLVTDIVNSQRPERVAFDTIKTSIARSDVVPSKQSVVYDVIQDSSSAYLYRQGMQGSVGTNLAVDALFRNRNIDVPTSVQDIVVNEQWMFSTGEFGRVDGKNIWELEIRQEDVTSNRQVIRFKNPGPGVSDLRSDSVIDIIGSKDARWVSRPLDIEFGTISRDSIDQNYTKSHNWLPSAGLADLIDTDVELVKLADLTLDAIKTVDKFNGEVTVGEVFSTRSFNRYVDYNQGDLAWYKGTLYRAVERVVGSATSAFDSAQWTAITIDGTALPSVWVSDYGFTLEQGIVASTNNDWVANKQYSIGDIVLRNGSYYKCILPNAQPEFGQVDILGIDIVAGGVNYKSGELVVFNSVDGYGSGANGTLVVSNGYITNLALDTAGYYRKDLAAITDTNGNLIATVSMADIQTVGEVSGKELTGITINGSTTISINKDYPSTTVATLTMSNGVTATLGVVLGERTTTVTTPITGQVNAFTIVSGGTGYALNDILTTNKGASFKVTGLTEIPEVPAVPEVIDPVTKAVITPAVPAVPAVTGIITTLQKISLGSGHVVNQSYNLSGGAGSGASITVTSISTSSTVEDVVDTGVIVGFTYGYIPNPPESGVITINGEAFNVGLLSGPHLTGQQIEIGLIVGVDTLVSTSPGFTIGQQLVLAGGYKDTDSDTVMVSNVRSGVITGFNLVSAGTNYISTPSLTISTENGVGAQLGVNTSKYWEILPQGYGWNVLQAFAPMYIEEICPNALEPGLNESKASFANPHRLIPGAHLVISGTGDGNYDTIHRVKAVVDDYNILIEARSTTDSVVYDAVGFVLNSVKFKTEDELANSTLNFVAGMKAYIDGGDIEGSYIVYNFNANGKVSSQNFEKIQVNAPLVDSKSIYKVQLFNYETRDLVQTLEVFDPYKGLTIDDVAQYIEYKQLPDPAVYNITELGLTDELAVNTWGASRVGTLWWDLDKVRYIEYEQYTSAYSKAKHWGERFANSEVAVYEWVSSNEAPTLDSEPDARTDTSASLNGQIRYSEIEEIDPLSGATTTRYYFWKRYVSAVPAGNVRPYSAYAIESVLNDPDANGIAWFSPIDTNAFVIANINNLLSTHNKLVLRVEKNSTPEQVHGNNVLVTEGFDGDVINEYLYRQAAVSVAGRDNYRESYNLHEFVSGHSYTKGQYVWIESNGVIEYVSDYAAEDYPVLRKLDDTQADVKQARLSNNGTDHGIYFVAKDFTATSMAVDIENRFLVKSAVSAIIVDPYENTGKWHAVINTRRRVPDSSLHPLRRYGNAYTPRPQSWFKDIFRARRTLVVAANEYLLNIDTVSKPNWDKYLTTYKALHGPYERDLTEFWTYVDYAVDNYVPGNEKVLLNSNAEISTLDDTVTNFGIIDEYGTVVEAYTKSGSDIKLVYRHNGTIQFLNTIWNGALGEAWDRNRFDSHYWDEDGSEIIESIFKALRYNIFVGQDLGYFNNLFFALVKESLAQIPYADWLIKTTYLNVTQTSANELAEVGTYYNKKAQVVNNYINEVKPYHSKIVESNRFNTTQEQVPVSVGESITMTTWEYSYIIAEDGGFVTTEDGKKLRTEDKITVQELQEGQG